MLVPNVEVTNFNYIANAEKESDWSLLYAAKQINSSGTLLN